MKQRTLFEQIGMRTRYKGIVCKKLGNFFKENGKKFRLYSSIFLDERIKIMYNNKDNVFGR